MVALQSNDLHAALLVIRLLLYAALTSMLLDSSSIPQAVTQ